MKNIKRLCSCLLCIVLLCSCIPVISASAITAPSITYEEALKYFNFSDAATNWQRRYHCSTLEEATDQILNGTSRELIIRIGKLAKYLKKAEKSIVVTNAFRPASYQESLCLYDYNFTWNSSKCKESNTYLENLKCWSGDTSMCAKPGASNHNTGESMDVEGWLRDIAISDFNNKYSSDFGIVKNVAKELWHVSLNGGGADKSGYDRFQHALDMGYEIVHMPCARNTSGYIHKGANVAEIQKKLNALGYTDDSGKKLTVDGIFGEKMEQAVKKFQKANGLSVDGICGANTLKKLFGNPSTNPTNPPSPPSSDLIASNLTLFYKSSTSLKLAQSVNSPTWSSSNTSVATVDSKGNVTATARGTATITVTGTINGKSVSDTCSVTVKYAWWQWFIIIVPFGWIWYI